MSFMVTSSKRPIDFSTFPDSDGEPVAENARNLKQMTDLIFSLGVYLAPRRRFVVGGNQFIYYNPRNGRDHISPDVYAALNVEPGMRQKWQTWLEGGKFPDAVFEITSESTAKEDLGPKVDLYARLGALEYYIYDPEQILQPPLRAYHRRGASLVSQPLPPTASIYSAVLGAELRMVGEWLRIMDPATGNPVPVPEEDHVARLAAERALVAADAARAAAQHEAEEARVRAEEARVQAEEARVQATAARDRARREEQGRLAAEDQVRRLQAALEELQRRQGHLPDR
jgi:Uma2 family endonuclease